MSDMKSRVSVYSRLTVVSSRSVGPGKTHRFSGLDHAMGSHTLHMVFYYRVNPFGSDIDSIRQPLSELLCLYPAVTGRLTRGEDGEWEVKCNDAGVRMLNAKVGATLDEWLRCADGLEERDLTVWEDMPEDPKIWSPFRIQMNEFEGGGLAIGLSCTHLHADPTTATLLVKSWSDIHRGEPVAYPPYFHRPPTANGLSSSPPSHRAATPSPAMSTATFRFPSSAIKTSLAHFHHNCPDATPFDFLAALLWTRVERLRQSQSQNQNQNQNHSLSICTDSRKLMHAPSPYGYFGNAFNFSSLSIHTNALDGEALGHVVEAVHRHMAGLGEEEEVRAPADWAERVYGAELTCVSMEHMMDVDNSGSGSESTSLMYAAMFEKGEKPLHVACHVGNVGSEGLIVVMPSPEGGFGRTVMLTLPEADMAKLREDQAILDLDPTMLVSGAK